MEQERRKYPRSLVETDVLVFSTTAGVVPGRTLDIGRSGLAALLSVELALGEIVELKFRLGMEPVKIHAMVRSRSVFRHGFEFLESLPPTCLSLDSSLHSN